MAKDKDSFIMSHKEGSQLSIEGVRMIFVDKVTGVNYFALCNGGGGTALTPLLDADGRVVVTNPALLTD
jgi:hypothetical protein